MPANRVRERCPVASRASHRRQQVRQRVRAQHGLTQGEITVKEIDAAAVAAKREGLVSKETLDWFTHDYRRQQADRGKKERQG